MNGVWKHREHRGCDETAAWQHQCSARAAETACFCKEGITCSFCDSICARFWKQRIRGSVELHRRYTMSYTRREDFKGVTQHVTSHADDGNCFLDDADRFWFLQHTYKQLERWNVELHSYALMDNHFHFLLTGQADGAMQKFMACVKAGYARYFNRRYCRRGRLWRCRYHAQVIRSDQHLYATPFYIEANPWRSGTVSHPKQYTWSSYRANSGQMKSSFLTPHPAWRSFTAKGHNWQFGYRKAMETYLKCGKRFKTHTPLPPHPDVLLSPFPMANHLPS